MEPARRVVTDSSLPERGGVTWKTLQSIREGSKL
jgi:hypothetical protein